MASWMVHLRIADALLAHWEGIDETAFVMGNLAPDSGVPNADWTAFYPPYHETHFQTQTDRGNVIDIPQFCSRYFHEEAIGRYSAAEYAFFLGYYVHLLTDVRWSKMTKATLLAHFPQEYAQDKEQLIRTAKEDWYDLDFLYLEQHPDFRAFTVFENAVGFENRFLDLFSSDAFDNRRQYICGFYHSQEHGPLHRQYRYLTPEQASDFVQQTASWILEQTRHTLPAIAHL